MKDIGQLQREAEDYRKVIQRLCSDGEGEWRPNALGYLLAQVKERRGLIADLDVRAFFELKHILEVTRRISSLFPADQRALRIAQYADQSLIEGAAAYQTADRRGKMDPDVQEAIDQLSADLSVLMGLLGVDP